MSGQEEKEEEEQANSRQGRTRRNRPRTKSTSDVRGMFADLSTSPATTAAQQMMCPRVSSSPGK